MSAKLSCWSLKNCPKTVFLSFCFQNVIFALVKCRIWHDCPVQVMPAQKLVLARRIIDNTYVNRWLVIKRWWTAARTKSLREWFTPCPSVVNFLAVADQCRVEEGPLRNQTAFSCSFGIWMIGLVQNHAKTCRRTRNKLVHISNLRPTACLKYHVFKQHRRALSFRMLCASIADSICRFHLCA